MMKISKFPKSELISFLSSYKESSLSIKININRDQDISYLKILEEQLSQLIHLQELEIIVPSNVILTEDGYLCITNAIKNLKQLVKLSINIGQQCYLSDLEFMYLKIAISNLTNLQTLALTIQSKNNLTSQVCQDFVDSLDQLPHLRKLYLHFLGHQKSSVNEGNVQFWRGIQYLSNLKKLKLTINFEIFGEDDLRDLYSYVSSFKDLTHLTIIPFTKTFFVQHLEKLIPYLGQMVQLRSLTIEGTELNQQQLLDLIKNLSNHQSIEKLKMQKIWNQLIQQNYQDYLTFLNRLTSLKKLSFIPEKSYQTYKIDVLLMSKALKQLTNLESLEIDLQNLITKPSDKFIIDLVDSFRQMSNLSILTLKFTHEWIMSQKGCNLLGDSFYYLQNLKKLEINYKSADRHDTSLIFNIRKLINLQFLSFITFNYRFQDTLLYDSISYLNQLEKLSLVRYLDDFEMDSPTNFESLSSTLQNLKSLKDIQLNIKIQGQNVKQLELFINAFEQLKTVERLDLQLNFQQQSNSQQPSYFRFFKNQIDDHKTDQKYDGPKILDEKPEFELLKYMISLKKLKVYFGYLTFNLFQLSPPIQNNLHKQLQDVDIEFQEQISNQNFVIMMDSLSTNFQRLKRLKLKIQISTGDMNSSEFGIACSKFSNLEKLIIDEVKGSMHFYAQGIKNMKKLKSLKFSSLYNMEEEEVSEFVKAVMNLSNLEKLVIAFSSTQNVSHTLENELNDLIKTLSRLKYLSIDIKNRKNQQSRKFEIVNSITLNQQQTLELINNVSEEQQPVDDSTEKQADKISNTEVCQHNQIKLQPTELVLTLTQSENDDVQQFYVLNQLEDINLSYLSSLNIQQKGIISLNEIFLNVDLFSRLDQLQNLRQLSLDLQQCIFSEEYILLFASNLKNFVYLDYFELIIETAQDYYNQLFQEFKELIHLSQLSLEMGIPETCAISLGNSLLALRNLQVCSLSFNDMSSYGKKGFVSILNGLRGCKTITDISLSLETIGVICDDAEIDSLSTSEFSQNLNYLEKLRIYIEIEETMESQQIISLYSSLLSSSLSSLLIFELQINDLNPFDQDMLNDLVLSLDNLNPLSIVNISVYIEGNSQLRIPKECARLCNKNPIKTLQIMSKENKLSLNFNERICIDLNTDSFNNLELEFLEELDENVILKCDFDQHNILSNFKNMNAKRVNVFIEKIENEENLSAFCAFLSLMHKSEELNIEVSTEVNMIELSYQQISSCLANLVNLKALNIKLSKHNIKQSKQFHLEMIQKLRNLQQLSTFSLSSDVRLAKSKLYPLLQRKMKRMVQVSFGQDFKDAILDFNIPYQYY